MNAKNIIESWFSTLVGMALIVIAVYDYFFTDILNEREAVGALIIGFIFMSMRDKLSEWIGSLVQVLLDKFKSKP